MKTDIGLGEKLRYIAENLEWRLLRAASGRCPICGPSIFLRFQNDPLGVRCIRCGAAPFGLSIVHAIRKYVPDLALAHAYEASSRGPLFQFLKSRAHEFSYSEFIDDIPSGENHEGIPCQDLQALSYPDESFDLCTSTEVLEHVADDHRAFSELHRVLIPGGFLIFSVPLFDSDVTLERAECDPGNAGEVRFLEAPQYHDDRIRGKASALVYRDYGRDILDRIEEAGFRAAIFSEWQPPGDLSRAAKAIVAQKTCN
jgi:SAM-dependent methyltransferase